MRSQHHEIFPKFPPFEGMIDSAFDADYIGSLSPKGIWDKDFLFLF